MIVLACLYTLHVIERTTTMATSESKPLVPKAKRELHSELFSVQRSKLQREHRDLKKVFSEIDKFVDKLLECERKKKWDWSGLHKKLQSCVNDSYFNNLAQKDVLGQYLSVSNAVGPMCQAYSDGLDAAQLKDFTPWRLKKPNRNVLDFLNSLREVVMNYTDASFQFCERICDVGFLDYFVADMKEGTGLFEHLEEEVGNHELVSLGTLYNCSRNPVLRQSLRDYNAGDVLLPFLKHKANSVRILAIICLSNIVDEHQNIHLKADESLFDFYIFVLRSAMASKDRRFAGFMVEEVVDGLTSLAKHDANKSLLVEKNVLPNLKVLLQGNSDQEIHRAIKCIWELAFDKMNREKIMKDLELIEILKFHEEKGTNAALSRDARFTLWTLALEDSECKVAPKKASDQHVMISYNWGDQKVIIQVKECLAQKGFRVWMDIEEMSGSILDAMAEAVENAKIVLVCMSERYKTSQNCRLEAEYALNCGKAIVPLMMQKGYRPDGWLGILKGQKLHFDFSGKYPFEKKMSELTSELEKQQNQLTMKESKAKATVAKADQNSTPNDHTDGVKPKSKKSSIAGSETEEESTKAETSCSSWTRKDVNNWLVKNDLHKHTTLKSLSGKDLIFMKGLLKTAPEFFYSQIKDEHKIRSFPDMRCLQEALEKLN